MFPMHIAAHTQATIYAVAEKVNNQLIRLPDTNGSTGCQYDSRGSLIILLPVLVRYVLISLTNTIEAPSLVCIHLSCERIVRFKCYEY